MATHTIWTLNLDAEVELSRAGNYATSKALQLSMQPHFARAAELLPEGAIALEWGGASGGHARRALPAEFRRVKGLCWCPTPSALKVLARAGAEPIDAPPRAVLARVNHRAFSAELGQTLPGARFVRDSSEFERMLREPSITGRWLCKRAFGFAGRGQRRLAGEDRADDRRWLSESIAPHGLQVEPCVEIEMELSVHGVVRRDGSFELGQICRQFLDPQRLWLGAERTGDALPPPHARALRVEAERVAEALHQAEYFGPFGVDAFLWRSPSGELVLNPRSEINARLTMAFPTGMGPGWVDRWIDAAASE